MSHEDKPDLSAQALPEVTPASPVNEPDLLATAPLATAPIEPAQLVVAPTSTLTPTPTATPAPVTVVPAPPSLPPSESGVVSIPARLTKGFKRIPAFLQDWLGDPDFSIFFVMFIALAALLYLRAPHSTGGGFVFDEQEAILANPYVRGKQPWLDAFDRDFWGLLPDRSIGSYRPIPNFLWRALWRLQEWRSKGVGGALNTPFVWFNIVFHATNAALLATMVRGLLQRVGTAWLTGAIFCSAGILTEAVSGIVGIADVLGGLSLLLALAALTLPKVTVLPAVFLATLFGLLSKESAIVNVGLVPLAAVLLADVIAERNKRKKPARWLLATLGFVGAAAALAVYFKIRHEHFNIHRSYVEKFSTPFKFSVEKFSEIDLNWKWTVPITNQEWGWSGNNLHWIDRVKMRIEHYSGAPNMPVDTFNNPLADLTATATQRVAGALRVYFSSLVQVLAPNNLSPDYSMPQEPIPPNKLWGGVLTLKSFFGLILFVVPPLYGAWLITRAKRGANFLAGVVGKVSAERMLVAYSLLAWPAAFFPLSNIPKALPTVRAERFWYTPVLATSILFAIFFVMIARGRLRRTQANTSAAAPEPHTTAGQLSEPAYRPKVPHTAAAPSRGLSAGRRFAIAATLFAVFFTVQSVQARRHANDFSDDLSFWESASKSVPNSAKAHLNFSVMLGARGKEYRNMTHEQAQSQRLVENIRATELAPRWDMAFIYVGDTLCQLSRMDEAWEWYKKGFERGSGNQGLIALALDCMSMRNALLGKEADARAFIEKPEFKGTWVNYIMDDTLRRERRCRKVDPEPEPEPDLDDVDLDLTKPDEDPVPEDSASTLPSGSGSFSGSASGSVSGSASVSTSSSGARSDKPVPSSSGRASAVASASASTSAIGSMSAASSTTGSVIAKIDDTPRKRVKKKIPVPSPVPPCGVDPKYRPRSLDGDPKSE